MTSRKLSMSAVLVAAALTLAGCATTVPTYQGNPWLAKDVPEEHGLVVLAVINNQGTLRGGVSKWEQFRSRRLSGEPIVSSRTRQPYELYTIGQPGFVHDAQLFVGLFPPGEYYAQDLFLDYIYSAYPYTYSGKYGAPFRDEHAAFRVEPGKITDLGTFVFNSVANKVLINNVESELDVVGNALDAYGKRVEAFRGAEVITYDDTSFREKDAEQLDNIRRILAYTPGHVTRATDGTLYQPAYLGKVYRRTPDGEWSMLHADTLHSVRHVLAEDDGSVFAVTAPGEVYRLRAGSEQFEKTGIELPRVVALGIGRTPDGSYHAVTTYRNGEEVRLATWHSPSIQQPQWREGASIPYPAGMDPVRFIGEHLFIGAGGNGAWRINLLTDEVLEMRDLSDIQLNPDGMLTALAPRAVPAGGSPVYSTDNGETWQTLDLAHSNSAAPATANDHVYMFGQRHYRTREEKESGESKRYTGILYKETGWEGWAAFGDKEGCTPQSMHVIEQRLVNVCKGGSWSVSLEGGEWRRESYDYKKGEAAAAAAAQE